MVARLVLTTNAVSPGTITHISGEDFNSQQGSGGSGGENARGREATSVQIKGNEKGQTRATSSVHIEGNEQGQSLVRDLIKESNVDNLTRKNPI